MVLCVTVWETIRLHLCCVIDYTGPHYATPGINSNVFFFFGACNAFGITVWPLGNMKTEKKKKERVPFLEILKMFLGSLQKKILGPKSYLLAPNSQNEPFTGTFHGTHLFPWHKTQVSAIFSLIFHGVNHRFPQCSQVLSQESKVDTTLQRHMSLNQIFVKHTFVHVICLKHLGSLGVVGPVSELGTTKSNSQGFFFVAIIGYTFLSPNLCNSV